MPSPSVALMALVAVGLWRVALGAQELDAKRITNNRWVGPFIITKARLMVEVK